MIMTFLFVSAVLFIKNQACRLRDLDPQEVKKIMDVKIQQIMNQLKEPQYFYDMDQNDIGMAGTQSNLDTDDIR